MNTDAMNIAISALMEWGKTSLISPHVTDYLDEIKSDFELCMKDGLDREGMLSASVKKVELEANNTLDLLKNNGLITASEYDDQWDRVKEALNFLDAVLYLNEGIGGLIAESNEKDKALSSLNLLMENTILPFMYDQAWSPLRLTVINDYRNKILGVIPEDKKYLFPWYGLFSTAEANTLGALMSLYDMIADEKQATELSEALNVSASEIAYELERDSDLNKILLSKHDEYVRNARSLFNNKILQAWRLGEINASSYPISDTVANIGIVRVSAKALKDACETARSQSDKIYWSFLAALCAPNLSADNRVELLQFVEEHLKDINPQDMPADKSAILSLLKSWFADGNYGSRLADTAFKTFNNMLDDYSGKFTQTMYEKDEETDVIWGLLKDIINKSVIHLVLWDQIIEAIESFVSNAPTFNAVPAPVRGNEDAAQEFRAQKERINISCRPSLNNHHVLLPPPNIVTGDVQQYGALYAYIGGRAANSVFCGGWLMDIDDQHRMTSNKKLDFTKIGFDRMAFLRIDKLDNWKQAILCISTDATDLETMLNADVSNIEKISATDHKLNLIVITITFRKED